MRPIEFSAIATCAGDEYYLRYAFAENDRLKVGVSYVGGCAQHDFRLILASSELERPAEALRLTLVHDGKNDPGKAIVREELHFCLRPLRSAWSHRHGSTGEQLRLRLGEYDVTFDMEKSGPALPP